jgi:hypothetical protein
MKPNEASDLVARSRKKRKRFISLDGVGFGLSGQPSVGYNGCELVLTSAR